MTASLTMPLLCTLDPLITWMLMKELRSHQRCPQISLRIGWTFILISQSICKLTCYALATPKCSRRYAQSHAQIATRRQPASKRVPAMQPGNVDLALLAKSRGVTGTPDYLIDSQLRLQIIWVRSSCIATRLLGPSSNAAGSSARAQASLLQASRTFWEQINAGVALVLTIVNNPTPNGRDRPAGHAVQKGAPSSESSRVNYTLLGTDGRHLKRNARPRLLTAKVQAKSSGSPAYFTKMGASRVHIPASKLLLGSSASEDDHHAQPVNVFTLSGVNGTITSFGNSKMLYMLLSMYA
ncbi:hypothetical protein C8Q80DRAFT_1117305 [Daedaleopsis nitida]|nr:hypothetical protein C8Q80DRAFT_1117305 [Daedaleopsis nitida]